VKISRDNWAQRLILYVGIFREDCLVRSFIICVLCGMLLGYQIKEDDMGGACGMQRSGEKCIQHFVKTEGRDHLEDLGVDRKIIL
jgi:hypothetical protein